MTLNFPSSPTSGQTYSLANGATYTWDGEKWKASNIPDSSDVVQTTDTPTNGEFLKWDNGVAVWAADNDTTYSNFTGDSGSGGAAGLVPAPSSGDAAAGKYLDSDGTWSIPPDTNTTYSTANSTTAGIFKVVDEDDMSSNASDAVPTQQSVKAYVDANAGGGGITSVADDTTPQLGGELDANSNKIINLTDPTLAQDAATKNYVDTNAITLTGTQTLENKTLDDYAELTSTRTENIGAFLVNASLAHIHNITTNVNSNAVVTIDDGQSVLLHITAGLNTVSFGTISWIGGSAPTLSTSGTTVIEFWKIGTTIYGAAIGDI